LAGIKWANKSCKKLAEKIFDQTTFFTTGYFVEEEKKISSFSSICVFFCFSRLIFSHRTKSAIHICKKIHKKTFKGNIRNGKTTHSIRELIPF